MAQHLILRGAGAGRYLPFAKQRLKQFRENLGLDVYSNITRVGDATVRVAWNDDEEHIRIIAEGEVYLWGTYIVFVPGQPGGLQAAAVNPEMHIGYTRVAKNPVYRMAGSTINTTASAFNVFVGDNYILSLWASDTNAALATTWFWSSIVRADATGGEYLPEGEGHAHHTITYIGQAFRGLGEGHRPMFWATGWENAVERFRFGMTAMYYTDPANKGTTKVPLCFVGSTGQYALTQVAYPQYSGRNHHPFSAYTAGLGKLQALNFVDNSSGIPPPPFLQPYLAYSNDHGSTWSSATVPWLTNYLYEPVHDPVAFDETQRLAMSSWSTIHYIGDGRTLLFIPNGYVDGVSPEERYAPMLFLGSGTSYTRVAWPPDTWYVARGGNLPAGASNAVGFTFMRMARAAHFSFGKDCLYLIVRLNGELRIMSTRDAGGTWAFSAPIPPDIINADTAGTVTKRYIDTEHSGRIIFPAPDYENNKLRFYATDGNFAEFKDLGATNKAKGTLVTGSIDSFNYHYVYYGGRQHLPYVFPAFPKEFDKPPVS